MSHATRIDRLYDLLFGKRAKRLVEPSILTIAIAGFFVHLALVFLSRWGWIPLSSDAPLLRDPIAAAYTPFTFILIYEVYNLVNYLPHSITTYISKQYQIITLIIFRRLFKDLAEVEISNDWFAIQGDLQFTYDIVAALVLFSLLHLFILQGRKIHRKAYSAAERPSGLTHFIQLKKAIAVILVPVLFALACYTFVSWSLGTFHSGVQLSQSLRDMNDIFFDEFFGILIIVDVVLLLISFYYTDLFHKVIRNSGFVISTILIRLSFSVDGLVSVSLVVASVVFGLLVLLIHNQYEKHIDREAEQI